jgi:tRNA modification GTPase
VIVVLDRSRPLQDDDHDLLNETAAASRLVVANKSDLSAAWLHTESIVPMEVLSSKTGDGMDALRVQIRRTLEGSSTIPRDSAVITNVRHAALVERARDALRRACESVEPPDGPVPEEFLLTDLQDARGALEEITGRRTSEDLLRHIFSRFCIGK